jgi:hypothetical protein
LAATVPSSGLRPLPPWWMGLRPCCGDGFCQADLQICESAILSKTLLAVAVVDVDRVVGR